MKVKIEINGDNAAFFDELDNINYSEFVRILNNIAVEKHLEGLRLWAKEKTNLRDINGNVCGFIEITE
jgi:hypothetical protein